MTMIGYARVSTNDQSAATQVKQLKAAGCTTVRQEKVSGKSRDVLNLVHELEQKGAHLRVLEPEINTKGPMGKMVLTALGMVAEMELGFIKERQRYKGRPATLDPKRIEAMMDSGKGPTEIATELGCSRGAIYKALLRGKEGQRKLSPKMAS